MKYIVFFFIVVIYGELKVMFIIEEILMNFKNLYGESKLMMEKIMKWCDNVYEMKYVVLCYFNVVGVKKDVLIGEDYMLEMYIVLIIL